ncbi:hypothetical protein ACDF64_13035 [Agromyces sp. MMS24-JH15]|uniref:hypothetical protein n=1 Tax=Agromyces sp. MMS24-JH15 TaxID=3243765 RepID=UPI003747DC9A
MQLGTRWAFGSEPPASVPAEVRERIAAAEAGRTDGAGRTWTLTWLEGRPIAELDDGTVVREAAPGYATDAADADDEW